MSELSDPVIPADADDDEEDEDSEDSAESATPEAPSAVAQTPAPADQPPPEPRVRRLNVIGRRNWYFIFSLLIIIPGILSMAFLHFRLGIDFAGGTEFTISFAENPSQARVEAAVASENVSATVLQTNKGSFIIRTDPTTPQQQTIIENDLRNRLGALTVDQVLEVGGTIAGETIFRALFAVALASVAILLLLAFRFRKVPGGWRAGFQFGGSALAALLHDVFVLTGIFSILGQFFHLRIGEIDSLFVTAVLTVVGFSVHDTIVVFDRIRENLRVSQRLSFEQVVNLSIMQTADRSIITSFTVVLVLASIFIAGGDSLKGFALALMIGIVSGTYSSIFNAAPLLVVWRKVQPVR